MEKKTKGRPAKPSQKRKRLHYSVWVSAEEKQQIDQLIEQANLPASQFFLTQVIEKPIQRPKKKTLPKSVIQYVSMLDKLSGLLALVVLKTKDRDMQQAGNWLQSSQNIKWISHLIALRIFEDFDFPKLKNKLLAIQEEAQLLYMHLDIMHQKEILPHASKLYHHSKELLDSFEKHYQKQEEPAALKKCWETSNIHEEIENVKEKLLKL